MKKVTTITRISSQKSDEVLVESRSIFNGRSYYRLLPCPEYAIIRFMQEGEKCIQEISNDFGLSPDDRYFMLTGTPISVLNATANQKRG